MRSLRLICLCVVSGTFGVGSNVHAQTAAASGGVLVPTLPPYRWWTSTGYPVSPYEGDVRANADLIRSRGIADAYFSRGAVNWEEARSRYIDNQRKWIETYYALRDLNRLRQVERLAREKSTPAALAAAARADAPRPLGTDTLDPITGRIEWPDALLKPDFVKPRVELEHLFQLSATTTTSLQATERIRMATQEMTDILRANVDNMSAHEFVATARFIESLEYAGIARG